MGKIWFKCSTKSGKRYGFGTIYYLNDATFVGQFKVSIESVFTFPFAIYYD